MFRLQTLEIRVQVKFIFLQFSDVPTMQPTAERKRKKIPNGEKKLEHILKNPNLSLLSLFRLWQHC